VSQLAHATNLYELEQGVRFKPSTGMQWGAMRPAYLKELPKDVTGTIDLNWNDQIATPMTYTVLGGSESETKDLCRAIQRQTVGSEEIPLLTWNNSMSLPQSTGCFQPATTTLYVAYAKY
jgi:hypothetical protein